MPRTQIELARLLLSANKQQYKQAPNPLRSHGPDHHWRVYQYAIKLADVLNTTYDAEVLAAAALLHDLAAYFPDKTGEKYHDYDHQLAQKVLEEIEFPQKKISTVLNAIANHGSDKKYKKMEEAIETTILRDADKLDVFGPIGIARIIMVRTLKGDTLEEIVADFYTNGHLQQKWDALSLPEARGMARKNYEYSLNFFKQLAHTLSRKD